MPETNVKALKAFITERMTGAQIEAQKKLGLFNAEGVYDLRVNRPVMPATTPFLDGGEEGRRFRYLGRVTATLTRNDVPEEVGIVVKKLEWEKSPTAQSNIVRKVKAYKYVRRDGTEGESTTRTTFIPNLPDKDGLREGWAAFLENLYDYLVVAGMVQEGND